MKILLIGRTGFVGRNMLESLSTHEGYEIDAPSHAELDALHERAVFERLMAGNYDVVLNCLDRHGAADAIYAEERLRAYHNFAHHADLYGKMIYYGSGAEYGRQEPLIKVSEADFGRFIPEDSYGFALYQMSLHALSSDNIYNLRLFGIFGKYEIWQRRFISNCICKALYGFPLTVRQERRMDFLDVDDLVKMTEWAISENPLYHSYNATSGKSFLLLELASMVRAEINENLDIFLANEGMSPEYTSDNSLIRSEMPSFEFKLMEESIQDLATFYKERLSSIDRASLLYQ